MSNQKDQLSIYFQLAKQAQAEMLAHTQDLSVNKIDVNELLLYLQWWIFYELDFKKCVVALINFLFSPENLIQNDKLNLSPERILDLGHELVVELEQTLKGSDLNAEDKRILLSLFINIYQALAGNIKAMMVFGYPYSLSYLINKVRTEDNIQALFDAILIDRTCLYTPTAQQRIVKAALIGDGSFFNQLSRALNGSRPRRTSPELDEVRLMEAIMADLQDFKPLSQQELCELFIDQLGIYPNNTEDPCGSLWKNIQRIRKAYKK